MTNRQSTHSHDCWSWGPAHYKCAVREIERLRKDAARYRWLRDREIPEWLDLWHQNPDRIDAAMEGGEGPMNDLIERLRSEAEISDRTGQFDRLNAIADEFAAEIKALRAEVEGWKGQHMRDSAELRRLCQHRDEYKARAELLAEALRRWWEAHRPVGWTEGQHLSCPHVNLATEAEKALATALLRDQEENHENTARAALAHGGEG